MSRDDWYRNVTWNEDIEAAFFAKLARARTQKAQYLQLQAGALAETHPQVALRLLEQYFALGNSFFHASAYTAQAKAHLAQGRVDEAVAAYEAALREEGARPFLLTQAYLDLPLLVATRALAPHYSRALSLLAGSESRLTFPLERFRWHAAHALIFAAQNQCAPARAHAERALVAASQEHSGFRYHPHVGVVGHSDAAIRRQLSEIVA